MQTVIDADISPCVRCSFGRPREDDTKEHAVLGVALVSVRAHGEALAWAAADCSLHTHAPPLCCWIVFGRVSTMVSRERASESQQRG